MINHLLSLLPRLKQYSKSLDDVAVFADIPWAFVDGDGDKVTYIFRRNNELLVSKRGDVATGRWEYLSVMQSMLIEYNGKKSMYNQGFVDNVVMALLKDGTEELFLLANLQKLPDLNVVGYLEGRVRNTSTLGNEINSNKVVYLSYELINPVRSILIESNEIDKDSSIVQHSGKKIIDSATMELLEDGHYRTTNKFSLHVRGGKIIGVDYEGGGVLLVALFIIILLVSIMFFMRS